jgi:hypothetical protein
MSLSAYRLVIIKLYTTDFIYGIFHEIVVIILENRQRMRKFQKTNFSVHCMNWWSGIFILSKKSSSTFRLWLGSCYLSVIAGHNSLKLKFLLSNFYLQLSIVLYMQKNWIFTPGSITNPLKSVQVSLRTKDKSRAARNIQANTTLFCGPHSIENFYHLTGRAKSPCGPGCTGLL